MKRWVLIISILWAGIWAGLEVKAEDLEQDAQYAEIQSQVQEQLLSDFSFEEIDNSLHSLFPEKKLDFGDTVTALMNGEMTASKELIIQLISDQISYEFRYNRKNLVHVLLIAVIAAVFTNFSNAFQNKQVSETSFYVMYMLLLTMCLNSFQVAVSGIEGKIGQLLEFMKVLCPAYFMAVAVAAGPNTSIVFYNIVLFLIYLAELIIVRFLLPLINVYIMVQVLNHLSGEDYLSQLAELLQKVVVWTLKTVLACVVGLNVIQGMLAPVLDSLQRSVITKTAQAIPGIGNAIGGVTDVVLGTAVLIKNGIGMAGVIVCVALCAVPLLQVVIMTLLYKLAAAVIQPVSDKRIVGCIGTVSEGGELLMRLIFTVGVLFLLTIAVVTASTT